VEKETVSTRVAQAATFVIGGDIMGWIDHSISFFDRYINLEEKL
jgi:hypothetical protein